MRNLRDWADKDPRYRGDGSLHLDIFDNYTEQAKRISIRKLEMIAIENNSSVQIFLRDPYVRRVLPSLASAEFFHFRQDAGGGA